MNPDVTIIALSAKTGEGLEAWLNWVKSQVNVPILLNC
jgi:hydrogenase nickel incorporation protein HypB